MVQKTRLATTVTSLNNEAAAGSGVLNALRRQEDSAAAMEHMTLRRSHQQSKCKKCFLWGPSSCYIRRADGSFVLVRSSETVGLQEGSLRKEVLDPGEEAMG
jgi:hypothetical protein